MKPIGAAEKEKAITHRSNMPKAAFFEPSVSNDPVTPSPTVNKNMKRKPLVFSETLRIVNSTHVSSIGLRPTASHA